MPDDQSVGRPAPLPFQPVDPDRLFGTKRMDATKVHYAIEYMADGAWGEWYATPGQQDAERMWKRVQAVQPRVPVRFVEVEILMALGSDEQP